MLQFLLNFPKELFSDDVYDDFEWEGEEEYDFY